MEKTSSPIHKRVLVVQSSAQAGQTVSSTPGIEHLHPDQRHWWFFGHIARRGKGGQLHSAMFHPQYNKQKGEFVEGDFALMYTYIKYTHMYIHTYSTHMWCIQYTHVRTYIQYTHMYILLFLHELYRFKYHLSLCIDYFILLPSLM